MKTLREILQEKEWYKRNLSSFRATHHGDKGVDDKERKAGQFQPFYVPRAKMPQVQKLKKFKEFAKEKGVKTTKDCVHPDKLKFHQRVDTKNLDTHINHKTPEKREKWLNKKVLVSKDNYILDGNTRTAAHKHLGTPVPVRRVHLPFKKAMKLLFKYPHTQTLAGQAA